jgi:hypothetical protein
MLTWTSPVAAPFGNVTTFGKLVSVDADATAWLSWSAYSYFAMKPTHQPVRFCGALHAGGGW